MDQLDQPVETEAAPEAAAAGATADADLAGDAVAAGAVAVAGDDLVEDVSIDGMCGVY